MKKNLENSNLAFMNKLLKEKVEKSDNFNCHFCLKPPEASFMFDCGHLPFCEPCSSNILKQKVSKCSVCNNIVTNRQRVFLESLKVTNSPDSVEPQNVTIID